MQCAPEILPGRDVPRAGWPQWRSALAVVPAHNRAGNQGERSNRSRESPGNGSRYPGSSTLFTATLPPRSTDHAPAYSGPGPRP